ncbi:type IV pilin N-terminal domain-containing protein [uncultured Methanospirillum sp.]|uniref:type IV pilin N-terminal domain-containing protein n=1 Tax=uncultured Methanospirillum sp. TaxID=262503 RepID=UPI0029C85AFF|nr:type IV pilin N-terminal domain-containing protein [uncultured Methanospirillum sp.]
MKEKAVSEIIGTIILVSIVLLGIGIVAVFMTSTPPPQAKSKSVLSSSCIDCGEGKFAVVIRHEGGDPINPAGMKYWLETQYPEGSKYERLKVNASKFFPAEVYSGLSHNELCYWSFNETEYGYNKSEKMINGDVSVISYIMKDS